MIFYFLPLTWFWDFIFQKVLEPLNTRMSQRRISNPPSGNYQFWPYFELFLDLLSWDLRKAYLEQAVPNWLDCYPWICLAYRELCVHTTSPKISLDVHPSESSMEFGPRGFSKSTLPRWVELSRLNSLPGLSVSVQMFSWRKAMPSWHAVSWCPQRH